MSLNLTVVNGADGVHWVLATGRIDSSNAATFEKDLLALYGTPETKVVVDMSGLDYISSAGLRVVLMGAKRAKAGKGRLVLSGIQPQVREVFEMSGFLKILETAADQAAAKSLLGIA